MLRWDTAGLTDIDSNMWYTSNVSAHVLLPQMPCESGASPPRLQVTSQPHNPKTTMLSIRTKHRASRLPFFIRTLGQQLKHFLNAETQDDDKNSMKSLYSQRALWFHFFFAGKLQTEILKWHAVRLTGGASKNTHGTQNKFFSFAFLFFLNQQPCLHRTP